MLVPKFKSNLLSVSSITRNGYTVTFYKEYAIVTRRDGSVAMRATMKNGLYIVNENSPGYAAISKIHNNNLTKWHNRLGHINFDDLKRMKGMVEELDINMDGPNEKCEICDKCKIHRLPFKSSNTREKRVLALIHSDICGPIQVTSLGRARYFATLIDDKTRYTEVAMLKKSDIFRAFKDFKSKAERLTGQLIAKLRTDNAKEYLSEEFTNYLKSEGKTRELSVPYIPQQNGVAKRANRTLVEMARCMLLQAKAPFNLWAEAVNAAAYIRNRCPTKSLDNSTPYEEWTDKKPYVGFMRIFGSRAIALDKRHKYNKFAPKGKELMLVGYSEETKAYRLWDRSSGKVEKHIDVLVKLSNLDQLFSVCLFTQYFLTLLK
ncbi:Retrovirus-related Pol polyprotein from transposon TNT 1-94 [Anthophora retusa]